MSNGANGFPVRAICFHLPQFHPVPENDRWWGRGFTEWTNVAKARPQFPGHYQPHLPADLGFYDLRLPEAREAQADLARQYGIYGFCYYHYWFNGRRILERPVQEILASGKPDFPFCLCWANENWSRRWDGKESEVLLEQKYSEEDDLNHIRSLIPAFADPRYIRVEGLPVFLLYRASLLPNASRTVEIWRAEAERAGLPGLYLCNVESMPAEHGVTRRFGFDAAVEFAPDWKCLPKRSRQGVLQRLLNKVGVKAVQGYKHRHYSYQELVDNMRRKPRPDYLRYPGVTPSWDNTARRAEGALILEGSSPERYAAWIANVLEGFQPPTAEENFIFINAWNEWAEGNHLEPCQRWGRAYLKATKAALSSRSGVPRDATMKAEELCK